MNYDYTSTPSSEEAARILGGVGLVSVIVSIIVLVLMLWIWGRIFHKAGYSGWLALLFLVPLANVFVIIWFAFAQWPLERRAAGMGGPPAYYPPQPAAGYAPGGYAPQPPAYQPAPPQQPGGTPPSPPPQG